MAFTLAAHVLTRLQLLASDEVVVVSRSLARELGLSRYVVAPEVDWRSLSSRPHLRSPVANSVLYVGRLEREKGADLVIPAVSLTSRAVELVIVGAGSLREHMERQAAEARPGLTVRFVGLANHAEVLAMMSRAHTVVVPSRTEGFGLAAFEALACGAFVCATQVGGLPEATSWAADLTIQVQPDTESLAKGVDAALQRSPQGVSTQVEHVKEAQGWTTLTEVAAREVHFRGKA
jgi:glycogen(starch) synthase